MVATIQVRSHRSRSHVRRTQVNANDLHDSSPSIQLTLMVTRVGRGGVNTMVAR
jgi:hypothetical protein